MTTVHNPTYHHIILGQGRAKEILFLSPSSASDPIIFYFLVLLDILVCVEIFQHGVQNPSPLLPWSVGEFKKGGKDYQYHEGKLV